MKRIVVGVDDASLAHRTLEWAVDEARMRNAELLLVHVYAWGTAAEPGFGALTEEDVQRDAGAMIDRTIAGLGGNASGLTIESKVTSGQPGHVLVELSEDAELLVVGSHGRGRVERLLVGSATEYCVHHAKCPVLVVRFGMGRR